MDLEGEPQIGKSDDWRSQKQCSESNPTDGACVGINLGKTEEEHEPGHGDVHESKGEPADTPHGRPAFRYARGDAISYLENIHRYGRTRLPCVHDIFPSQSPGLTDTMAFWLVNEIK